jgi:hypothetical protein
VTGLGGGSILPVREGAARGRGDARVLEIARKQLDAVRIDLMTDGSGHRIARTKTVPIAAVPNVSHAVLSPMRPP